MTSLSVNLNKIAVLRNSRGGLMPDLLQAARTCLDAGAHGLTVHPRPDARHIRTDDVRLLAALCAERGVEFNIEGNPFAPPRASYPGLLALCEATRPAQVTLVPDGDGQITSDHGFDFVRDGAALAPLIASFKAIGCRVSVFADVDDPAIATAATLGADRIELYTGPYAEAFSAGDPSGALATAADTALRAQAAGLALNAGHDLDQSNLAAFLGNVRGVREVSIGHALIGEALYAGLDATVRAYRRILDRFATA
ncbi:MAG: pyridoxine 5'-phosphate synthase [Thermomonas sp.]